MARTWSSYIPVGVVTRGLSIPQPSSGVNRASRGLIVGSGSVLPPPTDALLATTAIDANGVQRLLSDNITALHYNPVGQELFANPDREYTGYAANGFWYTEGVLDPTHVPFKATWAVEGEGPATSVRGTLDRFPDRLITVATSREVALFDADNLELWMRFVVGATVPPGAGPLVGGPGVRINGAEFVNGFLVLATNRGLRVANFRTDRGFRLNRADAQASGNLGLVLRNDEAFLDEGSTSALSLRIYNDNCLCLDVGAFASSVVVPTPTTKSARTVAAVGHPDGITAVRLDDPGNNFPVTIRHPARVAIATGWEVEDDVDLDDTSVFFVDDNFGATNWKGLGVQRGDSLIPDSVADRVVTKVENITSGRRLSVTPEFVLEDSGSSYEIVRPVGAVLVSPELHLYFANGSGGLAVIRDPSWAVSAGSIFSDLNVSGNNFSELAAQPDAINDLAKRGDLLLAATSLGVFVASDADLDGRRRAEFRYSTAAVTDVDATYKILEGEDSNCAAIAVDPETGNIQVAVTDIGSVVSEINPNIQQTFRHFSDVGRVKALTTFRNPAGPPDNKGVS